MASSTLLNSVELDPADLCSPDGFANGLALRRTVPLWSYGYWIAPRVLLYHVLREEVLPHLDGDLRFTFQRGLQNPLRATRSDGRLLAPSEAPDSWPVAIPVMLGAIVQIAEWHGVPLSTWARRGRRTPRAVAA